MPTIAMKKTCSGSYVLVRVVHACERAIVYVRMHARMYVSTHTFQTVTTIAHACAQRVQLQRHPRAHVSTMRAP